MKKHRTRILALVSALLTLACTACSAGSTKQDANAAYDAGSGYDYTYKTEAESVVTSPVSIGKVTSETANGTAAELDAALDERKIIKTMNITAETKTFDTAAAAIEALTAELGGYVEASSRSGGSIQYSSSAVARSASYTLRIPADQLDAFRTGMGDTINIVRESSGIDDITDQYYDVDARLETLKVQEERLLAMLEKATELEYLITLEQRLAEVRYEIESYTGTLRRYDSQVAYSTVRLTLDEVLEYTPVTEAPQTFGERIGVAFRDSWTDFADGCKNFAVGFVYALPTLIVLAVIFGAIAGAIVLVIKRATRKKGE